MKTLRRPDVLVPADAAAAGLPTDGAALWARQGRIRAEKGDAVAALRYFRRAIESDIDCLEAWIGLARVFSQMRDTQRSAACLDVVRLIHARSADAPVFTDRTILPLS